MAKKNEQEIPIVVDTRLQKIAEELGMVIDGEEDNLLDKVIERLQQMNESLMPLTKQMDTDARVVELITSLAKGMSLDEAVEVVMAADTDSSIFQSAQRETEMFCEKHKLEHDDVECFLTFVEELLGKIGRGEISVEVLDSLRKSFVFDDETKAAFDAGVVKGRNMQIEAKRMERVEDDGLGEMSAGSDTERRTPKLGYIEQIIKNRR